MTRGGLQVGGNYRGAWDSDTQYYARDTVTTADGLFAANVDHVSGATFNDDWWTALSAGGGGTLIAQPWQASAPVNQGDIRSQGGALYTAPTTFTSGATFNAANWTVGAPEGSVYEQNGSGQVVAIWRGNGTGVAATKIMDVAAGGLLIAGGTWGAGVGYTTDTVVNRNGSGYIAVQGSTGQDPATDNGTYWQLLASKGDQGIQGPPGSISNPATASALGAVKVTGGITDSANPTVRSADGFRVAALTADQAAITASTTLVDITGLGVPISASATEMWLVKFWLLLKGANTAMDYKIGFTAPAAATMQWGNNANFWAGTVVGSSPNQMLLVGGTLSQGTAANVNSALSITALVFGGGTAGTVQIQIAQNTSDAAALTVLKGSTVEATRTAV